MDRCKVLIIDGDIQVRRLVKAILTGIPGAEVCECADAAAAIALAAHWRADVALVDYGTQPMNGVLFTETVRAGQTSLPADLPVVLMCAQPDDLHLAVARRAGADEVLAKPLLAAAVVDALRRRLRASPGMASAGEGRAAVA